MGLTVHNGRKIILKKNTFNKITNELCETNSAPTFFFPEIHKRIKNYLKERTTFTPLFSREYLRAHSFQWCCNHIN